ncbi:hypothetical protein AB0M91_28725 [Micromonospora rifamycinica]|uniref:hypothetical protein n=1 Tax=Micromonospora rifamycinica TaxID=291594 RepID=UPI0033DAFE7C
MPDRHRDPTVTARPSQEVKGAVTDSLAAHGWTVAEAVIAALAWIVADPAKALTHLTAHRPPPKKTGRPKKRDSQSPT